MIVMLSYVMPTYLWQNIGFRNIGCLSMWSTLKQQILMSSTSQFKTQGKDDLIISHD